MNQFVALLTGMVAVGMAATVLSKKADTANVLGAFFNGLSKFQATNMGQMKG